MTETKGGQEVPVSADKIQQKAIKGTIPEPSADGSDQTVTVEVTYADGSKEEATVTISTEKQRQICTGRSRGICQ